MSSCAHCGAQGSEPCSEHCIEPSVVTARDPVAEATAFLAAAKPSPSMITTKAHPIRMVVGSELLAALVAECERRGGVIDSMKSSRRDMDTVYARDRDKFDATIRALIAERDALSDEVAFLRKVTALSPSMSRVVAARETVVDSLRRDVTRLQHQRDRIDCSKREGGDVYHCLLDNPCEACALRRENEELREFRDGILKLNAIDAEMRELGEANDARRKRLGLDQPECQKCKLEGPDACWNHRIGP